MGDVRFLSVVGFLSVLPFVISQENNACRTWEGYNNIISSPDCFYTPNIGMEVVDLIKMYFGDFETHEIETKDGYLITTFRLAKKDPKGIILFRHPAGSDSISFVGTGNESIAYYFWNKGYEIWLTNNRGTFYSQKHVRLTPEQYEYWNFGMEEIATLDLDASLEYIYNLFGKKKKIAVIGHSMGSTEGIIYGSLMPQEAKKYVNVFMLLSPTTSFVGAGDTVEVYAGLITQFLGPLDERDKFGGFMMPYTPIADIIHSFCKGALTRICHIVSGTTSGFTDRFDPKLATTAFGQSLRGCSVKAIVHYGQIMESGRFQRFDYYENNKKVYGTDIPPLFPVQKINTPMYLVYSESDPLAPALDIEFYWNKMKSAAKKFGKLKVPKMNHLDPLFGLDRMKIYSKFLELLEIVYK